MPGFRFKLALDHMLEGGRGAIGELTDMLKKLESRSNSTSSKRTLVGKVAFRALRFGRRRRRHSVWSMASCQSYQEHDLFRSGFVEDDSFDEDEPSSVRGPLVVRNPGPADSTTSVVGCWPLDENIGEESITLQTSRFSLSYEGGQDDIADNFGPQSDDFDSQSDDFDSQSDDLGSQPNALGSQPDDLGSQFNDFESQFDDANSQFDDFGSQPDDFDSQFDDFSSQSDDLGSQPDDFGSQPDDFGSQFNDFESHFDSSGSQFDDFGSQPDDFDSQFDDFSSQFDDAGSQPDDFDSQSDDFGSQSDCDRALAQLSYCLSLNGAGSHSTIVDQAEDTDTEHPSQSIFQPVPFELLTTTDAPSTNKLFARKPLPTNNLPPAFLRSLDTYKEVVVDTRDIQAREPIELSTRPSQ